MIIPEVKEIYDKKFNALPLDLQLGPGVNMDEPQVLHAKSQKQTFALVQSKIYLMNGRLYV